MQHTSDHGDPRLFFTREQLYAFSQPPSEAAINQVKKQGSDQDYLSGEYIRLVLNRYIGAGMYDLKVSLVGEPMREIIKKDKWENRQKVGTIDNVAVTANVSVEVVIYAPDGSGRTRHYSAVGSHTMYGAAEAGAGAIIGNAIKSAETSGLKRAVQPLGRAFGLDLKNKVKDSALPPGIGHFRRLLDERDARQRESQEQPAIEHAPRVIEGARAPSAQDAARPRTDARAASQDAVDATPSDAAPRNAAETRPRNAAEAAPRNAAEAAPRGDSGARETGTAPGRREPSSRNEGDRRPQARDEAPSHEPEVSQGRAARQEPRAETPREVPTPQDDAGRTAGQATEQAKEPDWELSLTPEKYSDWVACIKTMTKRVNAMTSQRELESFAKRNAKLIDALPVYPAEGDQQAKDFAMRWRTVMGRQYQKLDLPVPERYAPSEAKQPA